MLKFLTHKLRTHSISENYQSEKGDDNHDSGTESDEECLNICDFSEAVMSERICVSPADTGCSGESPLPSMDIFQDPHSSEEELEVINSPKPAKMPRPVRAASVCLPEKRKWSQISEYRNYATTMDTSFDSNMVPCYSPENAENVPHYGNLSPRRISSPLSPFGKFHIGSGSVTGDTPVSAEHSSGGSSDDEVHHLLHASMSTPVRFRTSPPLEALKPTDGRTVPSKLGNNQINVTATTNVAPSLIHYVSEADDGMSSQLEQQSAATNLQLIKGRSLSPQPKLMHCDVSPRKRSRHMRHTPIQRPCLDFEKMQQLKTGGVTAWRHSGDHGGELSVFCW